MGLDPAPVPIRAEAVAAFASSLPEENPTEEAAAAGAVEVAAGDRGRNRDRSSRLLRCDESFERHRLAVNETQDRVSEQERVIAVVPAERRFVQVGGKVLHGQLVVRADHGAVEQAPNRLNRVCVDVAVNPLVVSVADGFVPRVLVSDTVVTAPLVGVDRFGIVAYDVPDEAVQGVVIVARDGAEPDLAAALDGADHNGLVAPVAAAPPAYLAAEEGLVDLDDAVQELGPLVLHSRADAVAEIPGGLVRDAEHPLQLVCADRLLGLTDHVDGEEPLPERQLGIVEERSDADAELVAASVAVELPAFRNPRDLVRVAARAANAVRPAQLFKVFVAAILGAEPLDQLREIELLPRLFPLWTRGQGGLLDG